MSDKLFKTDNLSLAPFLLINGLKFVKTDECQGKNNKKRTFFVFEDPAGVGKDLERSFLNSPEKRYREAWLFMRNLLFKKD